MPTSLSLSGVSSKGPHTQSGFTLIELMVVMAIIAILATAGLSAYTGYIKKARDTTRAQIARGINTLVVSFTAINNDRPPTVSELNALLIEGGLGWHITPENTYTIIAVAHTLQDIIGIPQIYAFTDPTGGKTICLDAAGIATIKCQFVYAVYPDNTYAISYGIEHSSNRSTNFYTVSDGISRAGIFIGSAEFIGTGTGIPTTATTVTRIDDTTGQGAGSGDSCSSNDDCASNVCGGNPKSCHAIGSAGSGDVCTQNSDCVSGYCDGNTCSTGVTGEGSCQSNDACASGYCTNNSGYGGGGGWCSNGETYVDSCNSNDGCASGYCSYDNYCTLGASGDSAYDANSCQPGLIYAHYSDMCTDGGFEQPCDDDTPCDPPLVCNLDGRSFYNPNYSRNSPYCTN